MPRRAPCAAVPVMHPPRTAAHAHALHSPHPGKFDPYRLASFLVEFIILVLPQVATSMSDAPAEIFFLIVLLIWGMVSLKVWQKVSQSAGAKAHLQHQLQQLAEPRKR